MPYPGEARRDSTSPLTHESRQGGLTPDGLQVDAWLRRSSGEEGGGATMVWLLVAILAVAVGWMLLSAKFGASVRR
jgi:hypothetical protein